MKNFMIFVEGVHDACCVSRVLKLNDLNIAKLASEIPKIWQDRIPRSYQYNTDTLDRFSPIPDYYINKDMCIVIVVSNGTQNIIKEVDLYLSNMNKFELSQIDGICMIFDADQKTANEKIKGILREIDRKDFCFTSEDFIRRKIKRYNEIINLHYYFFPDNESSGTLENLLLDGADIVYKDILEQVDEYIENIDDKHKANWSISSENKVKIGCIANIFRPGSANQVSIFRDLWISEESIEKSQSIKRFYEFIYNIIFKLNNEKI